MEPLTKRERKAEDVDEERFVVVAVSGTLQEGFPLRKNLDYKSFKARFLGWGLARGMKSYFDLKSAGCREYLSPPASIVATNPAIVATGNRTQANIYAIYLVHEIAALCALLGEPRYLSMSPDVAKIDLTAEETSEGVRKLCQAAIKNHSVSAQGLNENEISLLTVVSTIRSAESFIENPILYVKDDGTEVTNFHDGLAKLCGTSDDARQSNPTAYAERVNETLRGLEEQLRLKEQDVCIHGVDTRTMRLNGRYTSREWAALEEEALSSPGISFLASDGYVDPNDLSLLCMLVSVVAFAVCALIGRRLARIQRKGLRISLLPTTLEALQSA